MIQVLVTLVLWGHAVEMFLPCFFNYNYYVYDSWPLQCFFFFLLILLCLLSCTKSPGQKSLYGWAGNDCCRTNKQTTEPRILSFSLCLPQAAINAMNLEQQLSQYAFFNQQPSSQNHQNQQVSFSSSIVSTQADCYGKDLTAGLGSHIFFILGTIWAQREAKIMSMELGILLKVSCSS